MVCFKSAQEFTGSGINPNIYKNDNVQVHWDSRYNSWGETKPCDIVDTTECPVQVPAEEEWLYYSVKKARHTVKYEVVISMGPTARIIWFNGAFGGSVHDLTIARRDLLPIMHHSECILADKAYIGENQFVCPFKPPKNEEEKRFNAKLHDARSNIERMNKRLKNFNILTQVWRHQLVLHELVFEVICNLVNLMLVDEPL